MRKVFPVLFSVVLSVFLFGDFFASVSAEVRPAAIFSSNMVLQREMDVPVWGFADPGEEITVSFGNQEHKTQADEKGKWKIELDPLKAGGPFTLSIKGKNELKYENVLIGEVWICSGQSNMEWSMNASADSRAEIPSVNDSHIRLYQVPHVWNQFPQDSVQASWTACNAETVKHFSAVAYYFGKDLQKELGVPIGLINSSWGGTLIEPWTPPVGFESVPSLSQYVEQIAAKNPESVKYQELLKKSIRQYKEWTDNAEKNLAERKWIDPPPPYPGDLNPFNSHQQPTVLYNAMVHPLVPFALRGAIWYQGESNRGQGMVYAEKMKALINGWRSVFRNEKLGFYYVQLAPYNYGNLPHALPEIWEAQAAVEKTVPLTGMAVINDIGDLKDIHPSQKKIVGGRLAKLALNRTYGKTEITCASPEMESMKIEGDTILLKFTNAKQLKTRDGKAPDWFEIAGSNGVYMKAEAKIEGTIILLRHSEVKDPCVVRFAWDMLAEPNVQNEAGLQLGTFRAGEFPEKGTFERLVPEGSNFQLLYGFDPTRPVLLDNNRRFQYRTDKSREGIAKIKKVGYFLYLKPKDAQEQFVFVSMPALDQDPAKLGVPTKSSGAKFQTKVSDVLVKSNVEGIFQGTFPGGCNVEFWDCNYGPANAAGIPGASEELFDFGDVPGENVSPGYGSMQIHNYEKKQTLFSFSGFSKGTDADVGIGNNPEGQPDWTFSNSARNYEAGQFLILVETE